MTGAWLCVDAKLGDGHCIGALAPAIGTILPLVVSIECHDNMQMGAVRLIKTGGFLPC